MEKYKRYKAVVIGCGRIGAEEWSYPENIKPATHAGAYWANSKTKLVGLCDINPQRLKEAGRIFSGVPTYSSVKKMLEETRPDIVSIATHPDSHYRFVKMAANFGVRAIVCEKPISDSLKKAEMMVSICKEKGSFLFIGHLRHFDPLTRKYQGILRNGTLGEDLRVNCSYYNGFFNNGTHVVDLLRWFLGDIKRVSGCYNLKTSNPKKDKNIDAVLYFTNKSCATLSSLAEKKGRTEWVFYGKKGELSIKKLGMEIKYNNLKVGRPRSLMAAMILHITACLDGKEKPLSTGQDGLAVLKILFAVKKSADRKREVALMA